MTRFSIELDECYEMVLWSIKNTLGGEIVIPKLKSYRITDLAKAVDNNCKLKIIGTRHGEKLYESLLSREEILRAKETERHFVIPLDERGLNYNSYFAEGSIDLASLSDYTSHNAQRLGVEEVIKLLMKVDFIKGKKF